MKSKLFTKRSVIVVILAVCIMIGLSFVANKTIIASRLEKMAYEEEYDPENSDDGLYLFGFKDDNGHKLGYIFSFNGRDYLIKDAYIPAHGDNAEMQWIEAEAFCESDFLEKVTVPDTIVEIKDKAFADCPKLKEIYIPSSVTSIGQNTFSGTTDFTMYVEEGSYAEEFAKANNITYDYYTYKPAETEPVYPEMIWENNYDGFNYSTFYYDNTQQCVIINFDAMRAESTVSIPEEINGIPVTTVAPQGFMGTYNIETLVLPETVTAVGKNAFLECNIKTVVFNNGDAKIGKDIFADPENSVIVAPKDSNVHKYAVDNNIKFEELS